MGWVKKLRCSLFGDVEALHRTREEREKVREARMRAESSHIEDTQDLLAESIRELLDSESAALELDNAIRSVRIREREPN